MRNRPSAPEIEPDQHELARRIRLCEEARARRWRERMAWLFGGAVAVAVTTLWALASC